MNFQPFVFISAIFVVVVTCLVTMISGSSDSQSGEIRTDIAERRDLMSVVPPVERFYLY